jgi:hypothetical protein
MKLRPMGKINFIDGDKTTDKLVHGFVWIKILLNQWCYSIGLENNIVVKVAKIK